MFKVLKSKERGHANHGWLDSYHSFSFANYYNPEWMGFKSLRVINQDHVEAGQGFGTHPHRDMEIISYVLNGALEHKDSMGTGSVIKPGDVQRMSAGTGVLHSEYNHSQSEGVDFLQIWILPEKMGIQPSYEQKHFAPEDKLNQLRLIASPNGHDGSVTIHQKAHIYASLLDKAQELTYSLGEANAWIQVIKGQLSINGENLSSGDGVAITATPELKLVAQEQSEFLLFDLKD